MNGALLPNVLDPVVLHTWVESRPRYEVTRTWYDEPLPGFALADFDQTHLRLRVASTAFYEDEFAQATPDVLGYDHATHYSYDIHGNVRTLVQDHPHLEEDACPPPPDQCTSFINQRHKRIDYSYDLISGNVKQVVYQKDQPDEFNHAYTYDADNRITEVETSADGENWHTDAKYFYYAHGPLQRVELGEHIVQGTDYAYTLQGWLKGVNSERLQPGNDMGHDGDLADADPDNDLIGRDAFGFALGYYGDADYKGINSTWDDDLATNVAQRPFAPIGTTGTRAAELKPLYNGNIATTTYTLEPFGNGTAGWDAGHTEGQVLAQVYTYDQLNRLKKARGVIGLTSTNTWDGVTDTGINEDNRYRSEYEYDANGNITSTDRYTNGGMQYDDMTYGYNTQNTTGRLLRNRLYQVTEVIGNSAVTDVGDYDQDLAPLIDGHNMANTVNTANKYGYDALGNLVRDNDAQISLIEWTVAGKVKSVTRSGGPLEPLRFGYGASGQRIMKQVGTDPIAGSGYREHYIRDAQGNIMATYRYTNTGPASLKLGDRPVYGSSRLGTYGQEVELHSLQNWDPADPVLMDEVALHYELTDHLGNVCAVVTGRLMDGNGGGTLKQAELVSAQGYEPFGSLLPGRNFSSDSYRFGFNGKENDNEVHGATGTFQDYGMRAYDTRVGRFFSVDPIGTKYPMLTPYQFASNSPIQNIDLDGLEGWQYCQEFVDNEGETCIKQIVEFDVHIGVSDKRIHGSYTVDEIPIVHDQLYQEYHREQFYDANGNIVEFKFNMIPFDIEMCNYEDRKMELYTDPNNMIRTIPGQKLEFARKGGVLVRSNQMPKGTPPNAQGATSNLGRSVISSLAINESHTIGHEIMHQFLNYDPELRLNTTKKHNEMGGIMKYDGVSEDGTYSPVENLNQKNVDFILKTVPQTPDR